MTQPFTSNVLRDFARACTPRVLRNWLRNPRKTARYIADRVAYAFGSLPQVCITDQWSVCCHPAARSHFEVFRNDPSQMEELGEFVKHARPGMQLLDVGAHYGFFALAALHYGGPDARVICIEPSAKAVKILRADLKANHPQSRAQIIEAALGPQDGRLPMLTTGPAGADYFMVPSGSRRDTIFVTQRSMRSVLRETAFAPTHIKMDIEGYELEAIESAVDVLAESKPVFYLELHGNFLTARGKDPAAVIMNMRKAGYTTFLASGKEIDENEMARSQFMCRLVCLVPQQA